jgi:hypothetical protein
MSMAISPHQFSTVLELKPFDEQVRQALKLAESYLTKQDFDRTSTSTLLQSHGSQPIVSWSGGVSTAEARASIANEYSDAVYYRPYQSKNLNYLLADLLELKTLVDSEDFVRPTAYAVDKAIDFCIPSGSLIKAEFPYGSVAPDGDGGIRIEWMEGNKHVRLLVSANADTRPELYYEDRDEYDITPVTEADELAIWLDWLVTV